MRNIILVIVVALLVIGGGIFFLSRRGSQDKLTVFKDAGSISVKSGTGEYEKKDQAEFTIDNNSFVKTDAGGTGHVVLPDNSMISLSNNTEMQIKYSPGKTDIFQSLGNAWYRVQKLSGKNEFTVETPTIIAAVRGTIFGVERGTSELSYVTDGTIEIVQIKDVDGNRTRENIQTLETNKLITIGSAESAITDIPEEKKNTPWFRRNAIINEEFLKGTVPTEFLKTLKDRQDIKDIDVQLDLQRMQNAFPDTLGTTDFNLDDLKGTGWFANGAQACAYINSDEYSSMLDQLGASRAVLGTWVDWMVNSINAVKSACSDNIITPDEQARLESIYENQPDITPSLPNIEGLQDLVQ